MTSERPQCPHHKKCGGCQLQNLSYPQQLEHKQKTVIRLLGGFCHVEPIIGMKYPYNYRNKVQAAFGTDRSGRIISGVYQSNSHRIVPVDRCMIEDRTADQIIVTIRQMLRSFKISAYNEATGRGFLRHVLVKRGFKTGQIMVVLVTAVPAFPSKRNFLRVLLEQHPEITTVVQNINTADTNLVLGPRQTVLYGSGYIEDELCACRFRISPKSFYQINPIQTQVLYNKAMDFARISPRDRVIDAYCGIGTIGLVAARRGAGEVIGVELNPDAVKDARNNARLNGQKNITFYTGDAGQFMEAMAKEGRRCDVLFMDPPRAGSSETFLSAALTLAPGRIVYISCNPETLARDLKFLTVSGAYAVKAIQPVDMFPFTEHVETVCLLSKLNAKQHIEINLDMDELDLTDAEKKATYQEIKDYVLEHSGLKVSSLYIAQVKQKCGIIERENYNKPKSEDAKQPQCPPDKEKAIKEALTHFGMI
jgi:23S rRNA (uracil1939-C5)-methyltransferase